MENRANPHLPHGPRHFQERFSLKDEKTGERVFVYNGWFLMWREFEGFTYIIRANRKRVHIQFPSPVEAEYYALRLMRDGE